LIGSRTAEEVFMKTRLVLGLSLALSCSAAYAVFIDKGDTTVDTSSNLEWLDMNLSRGFTFQEVATMSKFAGWRHATVAETSAVFVQFGIPLTVSAEYHRVNGDLASGPFAYQIAVNLEHWRELFNIPFPVAGNSATFEGMVADVFPNSGNIHPLLSASGSTLGGLYESGAFVGSLPPPASETFYATGQYAVWGDGTVGLGETYRQFVGQYDHFLVRSAGLAVLDPPIIYTPTVTPVPEPETYALMLLGLAAIGARRRRRR
jgi:hypothetical protein